MNLLGSMNMPIIMTGRDLRIRRFTPMAEKALAAHCQRCRHAPLPI